MRRHLCAGGLAAVLLALSALPVAASPQRITFDAVSGVGGGVNFVGAVFYPLDGSTITIHVTNMSGGTNRSFGVYCNPGTSSGTQNESVGYSGGSGFSGGRSFTVTSGSHSNGCRAYFYVDGSGGSWDGAYIDYEDGTVPGQPNPTAQPHPTSTPGPIATPPPGATIPYNQTCMRGTPNPAISGYDNGCDWSSAAQHQYLMGDARYPDEEQVNGGLCTIDWVGGPLGCYVDGDSSDGFKVRGLGTNQTTTMTVFAEYDGDRSEVGAVNMWASVGCRGAGGSGSKHNLSGCTYSVEMMVQMYGPGGYTEQTGAFRRTVSATLSSAAGVIEAGLFTVPKGTKFLSATFFCGGGTLCGNAVDDDTSYVDWIRLGWRADTSGATDSAVSCSVPSPPADCGLNPEPRTDPNTGAIICGVLSGDCAKPFIEPLPLSICTSPSNALDAVGWLAFIACLIGNLPVALWNLIGVGIINFVIDLLIPGRIGEMFDEIKAMFSSRAIFAWVGPTADAWNEAWTTVGTSAVTIGDFTFKGETIPLGDALATAMDQLAPFRDLLLGILMVGIIVKGRNRIMTALNGGSVQETAT